MPKLFFPRSLVIRKFAKQWDVTEKTARRDLSVFRKLGQEIVCERECGKYVYRYDEDSYYLFVANP